MAEGQVVEEEEANGPSRLPLIIARGALVVGVGGGVAGMMLGPCRFCQCRHRYGCQRKGVNETEWCMI